MTYGRLVMIKKNKKKPFILSKKYTKDFHSTGGMGLYCEKEFTKFHFCTECVFSTCIMVTGETSIGRKARIEKPQL